VQLLWKATQRSLKKLKIELPDDPMIPLPECAPGYDRVTCKPMFIAALFIIAKLWKLPRCPTTYEWYYTQWCFIHP
jgi:hypothetical protein